MKTLAYCSKRSAIFATWNLRSWQENYFWTGEKLLQLSCSKKLLGDFKWNIQHLYLLCTKLMFWWNENKIKSLINSQRKHFEPQNLLLKTLNPFDTLQKIHEFSFWGYLETSKTIWQSKYRAQNCHCNFPSSNFRIDTIT